LGQIGFVRGLTIYIPKPTIDLKPWSAQRLLEDSSSMPLAS